MGGGVGGVVVVPVGVLDGIVLGIWDGWVGAVVLPLFIVPAGCAPVWSIRCVGDGAACPDWPCAPCVFWVPTG